MYLNKTGSIKVHLQVLQNNQLRSMNIASTNAHSVTLLMQTHSQY